MRKLIESLQNTTKRNEKLDILKKYKNNKKVKELLEYTYNPHKQFFVKKIWKPEKVGNISLSEYHDVAIELLTKLNNREITGHNALQNIKDFMEKLDKPSQKIFEYILKKDLKCGINTKSINKTWPNLLPEEDFQLAEKYNPEKDYGVDYWYWSYKLDGIRCRIDSAARLPLGRNGKEINNTHLIVNDLEKIFIRFPEIKFIDGEIWSPNLSFNEIMSIISKHKFANETDKNDHLIKLQDLQLWVFAIVTDDVKTTEDMIEFINDIQNFIEKDQSIYHLKILPQRKIVNDYNVIMNTMKKAVNMGYEGIMLRHPIHYYEFKRSNYLLKVKPIYEADLKVTDIEPGYITMYENDKPVQIETMTAIYVEGYAEDNKRKEYVYTRVGSGFTFEDRNDVFNNPEKYIGKYAEIEFQELTKNKDDKSKWSLRFPVFKRWRFDKS